METTEPTNKIYLHSLDLEVEPVQVQEVEGGRAVAVDSQSLNVEMEQLRVELGDKLTPHKKYIVKVAFKGKLGDDLHGLYRSSYLDEATNTTR